MDGSLFTRQPGPIFSFHQFEEHPAERGKTRRVVFFMIEILRLSKSFKSINQAPNEKDDFICGTVPNVGGWGVGVPNFLGTLKITVVMAYLTI